MSADANNSRGAIKSGVMSNQHLADKLHKPIIRKCEKRNLCSSFKDNTWGVNIIK